LPERLNIRKLNPAVDKKYHILISGLMWCGVGIMLISFATGWIFNYNGTGKLVFASAGVLLALPIHFFGFSKLAGKNIVRLMLYTSPRCVFSFMTFKSWITVIIMMAMGIGLRHSQIPKQYLAVLYIAIGAGLFLSGTIYLKNGIRLFLNHRS
jgi:hypothetical protein